MKLVFVDTSGIVAAMNAKDKHHEEAKKIFYRLAEEGCTLVITNYVRAETHALLLFRAGREIALRFLEEKPGVTEWVEPEDEEKAIAILRRFKDKDFSLTDATSFAVMERLGTNLAVSFDRHFRQYGFQTLTG